MGIIGQAFPVYYEDFENEETLAIALDYEFVAKFATQFMKLYNKK